MGRDTRMLPALSCCAQETYLLARQNETDEDTDVPLLGNELWVVQEDGDLRECAVDKRSESSVSMTILARKTSQQERDVTVSYG